MWEERDNNNGKRESLEKSGRFGFRRWRKRIWDWVVFFFLWVKGKREGKGKGNGDGNGNRSID